MGSIPVIHSNTTQCICSVCFAELIIEKVKSRKVFTVAYGELQIRERVKKCPVCGKVYRSVQLPKMVKAGCNYSYDCIVEAGRLRYIDKRQISEIQNIFTLRYHLNISQTQIRRLCYNFLYYMGRFHYHSAEHISDVFQQQGGYVLYVDSTCEGRGVHILSCLDGQSGYVLYSKKIKSENSEDLQTAFGVVKNMFGVPLCCVHDMGNGINKALDIVFEGVMRIICHFHLLRDIGNDLLKKLYRNVQKSLSGHGIYVGIRYQTLALEKTAGSRTKAEDLFFSYHGQYIIENIFKETKDSKRGCWWPVNHWTDHKIKVHGLYCTVTLLMRALMIMKTDRENINLSLGRLHDKLNGIKQVINIYPKPKGKGNKKKVKTKTLTKMDEIQQRLFELFK